MTPSESWISYAKLSSNVGVELGQLAIVAAFLPLAYLIRLSWSYPRLVLTGGSVAVIAIALVWFTERAFDLTYFLSNGTLLWSGYAHHGSL